MIKVGVTGGIGCGKSYICDKISREFFTIVYNSDIRGRVIMENNPEVIVSISRKFGSDSYEYDNHRWKLNVEKFRKLLFTDDSKRRWMNNLIRPYMKKEFESFCNTFKDDPFILFESAILFDSKNPKYFTDFNILVVSDDEIRNERLLKRGLSLDDIENRKNCQPSESDNKQFADFIIENNGDDIKLDNDIKTFHKKIMSLNEKD